MADTSEVRAGPRALFVSPHLDDVAFSCGGTVARLADAGWRTVVVTAFTASVPDPAGFALACQLDKGLPATVDYLALRRAEDERFAQAIGVDRLVWLGLPEAPHRGYESAPALFAERGEGDDVEGAVADGLRRILAEERPDIVFAPQALGSHVDHRAVVAAVLALGDDGPPVWWYRDTPYAIARPDAVAPVPLPAGLVERCVPIDTTLAAKVRGALAYATQIGFQFGGPERCAAALDAFARAEAARGGLDAPAEVFLTPASVPPGGALDARSCQRCGIMKQRSDSAPSA